jgi:hypothetical protein
MLELYAWPLYVYVPCQIQAVAVTITVATLVDWQIVLDILAQLFVQQTYNLPYRAITWALKTGTVYLSSQRAYKWQHSKEEVF